MGTKVYVQSQGCRTNEYAPAKMFDVLAEFEGAERVADPAAGDLLLLHTCSIREKARGKVFSQLGQWRRFKHENPHALIGVGGCVASQEGAAALAARGVSRRQRSAPAGHRPRCGAGVTGCVQLWDWVRRSGRAA